MSQRTAPMAVLFSGDPETGECSMDVFRAPEHPDPHLAADRLRRSCEDDFPGRVWSIRCNPAAAKLKGERFVRELMGR